MNFVFDATRIEALSLKIGAAAGALFFAGLAALFASADHNAALFFLTARVTVGTAATSALAAGVALALIELSLTVTYPAGGRDVDTAKSLLWWAERAMFAAACGLLVALAITTFGAVFVVGPL